MTADLDALEQAARGVRDGTLVYDYATFQLLIAAVREADALDVDRLAEALGRADGVQGFGGKAMQLAWAERIAAEYAALSATEPAEEAK